MYVSQDSKHGYDDNLVEAASLYSIDSPKNRLFYSDRRRSFTPRMQVTFQLQFKRGAVREIYSPREGIHRKDVTDSDWKSRP